jgi:RHS repeat-associated protein
VDDFGNVLKEAAIGYGRRDPNRNRAAAAFDALGMVVATAVMGKNDESLGDLLEGFDADPELADLQTFIANPQARAASLLGKATTRIIYDLERYRRAGQPPLAATLTRETHFHDLGGSQTKIQIGFSYSDGFEREIQSKMQAEAGNAPERETDVTLPTGDTRPGDLVRDASGSPSTGHAHDRWVGSGRTVFNNKGNPVRQYEPFFSATHLYEPEREMTDTGVSPVLFYDPLERVVATLHPNHTYEKVVFDPWRQTSYDLNDTVAANGTETGDPRTDEDIKGYFSGFFEMKSGISQTWHAQRIDSQMGSAERDAAQKAAFHANTPTVAHLDALGRPFLTIAHNRFEREDSDGTTQTVEERYPTRIDLDIEGNERVVRDAFTGTELVDDEGNQVEDPLGRIVMLYDYDMLGNRIHQESMEAGERWMLNDATGDPIRAWDSRRFLRRMAYDELRRPTNLFVTENGTERLAMRTVYGEGVGVGDNHRTRVHQVFDGAGVVTSVAYDFKGNVLESLRELLPTYKQAVDWLQDPAPNDGSFTSRTTYDAFNRPLTVTTPDASIYRPTFNEANLLEKVDVNLRGEQEDGQPKWTPFVTNIDYDAKGQRERIEYANRVRTAYEYDPLTFRLTHLKSTRPDELNGVASQIFAATDLVQDLHYTYDPVGNITRIEDHALKRTFRDNQIIDPACSYVYDATYRLIEARGREHIGQTAFRFAPEDGNLRDYPFVGNAHPNDVQALRNYTERYAYDEVGNFDVIQHIANSGRWTRSYEYEADSLIEPGKKSNRLTKTTVGNGPAVEEVYTYSDDQSNDVHGCMTAINTMNMAWDAEDRLQQVDLGGGGTAYYVYDAGGQRVRKVIETRNGAKQKERLYLGGFEVYRKYGGNNAAVGLERQSLHIMDDQQRISLVETQTIKDGNLLATPIPLQRYQLGNHLGSASMELSEDGALISYEEYHPYGTTAFQAGRSAAETSLKRYRFTGMEKDEETGMAYHTARYYLPWLGRWCSTDPIGIGDGVNVYRYVRNQTTTSSDKSGKQMHQQGARSFISDSFVEEGGPKAQCSYDAELDLEHSIDRFNILQEQVGSLYEVHISLKERFDRSREAIQNEAESDRGNQNLLNHVAVVTGIYNELLSLEEQIDNIESHIDIEGEHILTILENHPGALDKLVDRMNTELVDTTTSHDGEVISELTPEIMERSISQREHYNRLERQLQVGQSIANSPTATLSAITMLNVNPNVDFGDKRAHARIVGSGRLINLARGRMDNPMPHTGVRRIDVPSTTYKQIESRGLSRGDHSDRQVHIERIGKSGRPEGFRTVRTR